MRVYVPGETTEETSNLSDDLVVEVPALIGGDQIEPVNVGPLPDAIAAMCEFWGRLTNIIADGAAEGSKEKLLDEMLEYNKKYDTRFS